jgi:hypothetical protein
VKKEPIVTDDLLARYLTGEVSEAEQQQVLHWISESTAHKKQFDDLKLIWNQSKHVVAQSAVSEDAAWARFKERTEGRQERKVIPMPRRNNWLKVAAALLLLAGGSWLAYYLSNREEPIPMAAHTKESPVNVTLGDTMKQPVDNTPMAAVGNPAENTPVVAAVVKTGGTHSIKVNPSGKGIGFRKSTQYPTPGHLSGKEDRTQEFLCNSTPCPIEICIVQSVNCQNGAPPIPVSTCSTLEPDQSGQLRYKAFDKIARNCKTTVQEIRITRVSTGETIVLNENSSPSTAQDFFNYITGQKQGGDIVAGIFHSDCNNHSDDCGLSIDNLGNLILQ